MPYHTYFKAIHIITALENLECIRMRTTVRKGNRYIHNSWSFHQLRSFIEYKATEAGIPVIVVNTRNTIMECPACHTVDKGNRPERSLFRCISCGLEGEATSLHPSTSGTGLPSTCLLWLVLFLIIRSTQLQANMLQLLVVDNNTSCILSYQLHTVSIPVSCLHFSHNLCRTNCTKPGRFRYTVCPSDCCLLVHTHNDNAYIYVYSSKEVPLARF